MPDYKKMYFSLAAKVADAIDLLSEAQQQGENDYIEDEHEIISHIKTESIKIIPNKKDTTVVSFCLLSKFGSQLDKIPTGST
jgi:hypothetical protein